MERHTRQVRLADVGTDGQRRIARAVVEVPGHGLGAEVAARYLAGAGVAAIRLEDEEAAAAARSVDPVLRVELASSLADESPSPDADAVLHDPSARALARGALRALRALREALAG